MKDNMEEQKKWYVVNTYSGHEAKVKEKLDMKINSMDMQDNIFRVIVPERKEVEIKDGKRKEKIKKLFPGYVLVQMIMSDESWYNVRNTPGVTGFLGSSGKGAKPVPLYDEEVERIFKEIGLDKDNVVVNYEVGDKVKITDGPFKMLAGQITDIDLDNGKANVLIDLFGQETNVELELTQFTNYYRRCFSWQRN